MDASHLQQRDERRAEYQQLLDERTRSAEQLGARSRRISTQRALTIGVSLVLVISAAWGSQGTAFFWAALFFFVLFIGLVIHHARVLVREDRAWRLWRVASNAKARIGGAWKQFSENGQSFANPQHPNSGDLDVFGPGSLFQFINVAHTRQGQQALAETLTEPGDFEQMSLRQQAVKELVPAAAFRQSLEAHTLSSPEAPHLPKQRLVPLDLMTLISWAESEPKLKSVSMLRLVAWGFPSFTLGAMAADYAGVLPALVWQALFTVQIFISAAHSRVGAETFGAVASSPGVFARLQPTLELIEKQSFSSESLVQLQSVLGAGSTAASTQMRRMERVLSWFELRRNGMVYPIINALLLWDLHCVLSLEGWQHDCGKRVRKWLSTLGQWEALSSLAGFGYDNPEFVFPQLVEKETTFSARQLGHPLLDAAKRVSNDVGFPGAGSALLVTGSNMSGKSTLLRSMGLAVTLGHAGAPVCAAELRLSPFRLHTSMRISDSLSAGVSHFYAELEKLRATLQATERQQPVFFLLDEILHGTNSDERQIGARWVLSQLILKGATGAVSTHDLALCELPPEWMSKVRTVHLRETVEGGKMSFDYLLREGPVQGGNALLLMRSLGLNVPLVEVERG